VAAKEVRIRDPAVAHTSATVQPAAGRWPFREMHARTVFGA
jgi:hypothetical protein